MQVSWLGFRASAGRNCAGHRDRAKTRGLRLLEGSEGFIDHGRIEPRNFRQKIEEVRRLKNNLQRSQETTCFECHSHRQITRTFPGRASNSLHILSLTDCHNICPDALTERVE